MTHMSFAEVAMEAFDNKELVAGFERLYGVKVVNSWPKARSAIEAMVDKATGAGPTVNENGARAFIRFVWDFVWTRMPPECFEFVECDGGECCKKERLS